ncbi:MAG: GNAT family N-acetyltransferase [Pseudonocardiaceae bacterium]
MIQSANTDGWPPDDIFCRLLTPRLEIRRFTPDDARPFAAYRSDPCVARYQGWDTPYPLSSARQFIEALGDSHPGTPGQWFQFAVARRDDGALAGDCAARPRADDPRVVEIGFSLARGHQGRGYATEAVRQLLDYLFEDERGVRPVHRVTAGCDVRNTRSAALLERVGMRREGHLVESEWFKGEWTSEYRYALLRREWVQRQQLRPAAGASRTTCAPRDADVSAGPDVGLDWSHG